MEPLLKYIIYFLLGLICHYLLFKGDLIENYLDPVDCLNNNNCTQIQNYMKRDGKCSVDSNDCSKAWTTSIIKAYNSTETEIVSPPVSEQCLGNLYNGMCFDDRIDDNEACKHKCNNIRECGAYSFNDNKCCVYKQGYVGSGTSSGTNDSEKCYSKLTCNQVSDINCICGDTSCIGFEECSSNNTCLHPKRTIGDYRDLLDDCPDEGPTSKLCKCGKISSPYNLEKSGICDIGFKCSEEGCKCISDSCGDHLDEQLICKYIGDKTDSDIIPADQNCYCDWSDETLIDICQGINGDTYNYCNASNASCEELLECNASNTLIKKPCKYTNNDDEVEMCRINQMYDGTTCKIISDCTYTDESQIISSGGECFCEDEEGKHLCEEGKKCTTSGCKSLQDCPESYTYNESLKKCVPPNCDSATESAISSTCVCTSDTRTLPDNICNPGNYCFDASTSSPGCIELPEECQGDTLISASCVCPHDTRSPQPYVCGNGHYCTETDGCYKTECTTGKKINPDNHKQCIDKDHEKNLIERFIDALKKIFD